MATGICYTQSGNVKRYEDGVSISLVKGTHDIPTIKNDILSVANENHYSFEVSTYYKLHSKGNYKGDMPLVFVTYYPSSNNNPCYFNFDYNNHTVKIILYYLWPIIVQFKPFNKNNYFNIKINKPDGNYYEKTIKKISDLTFSIPDGCTVSIEDFSLGFDLIYSPYSFFNYADTFILNDVKSWEITQDTTIDLYITNKRICLSPLWNWSSTRADYLSDGSAISLSARIDSGGTGNKMLKIPEYSSQYGQCCVIGYQKGNGGLFFGAAPLIPSFGYDYLGTEVGWLPSKEYSSDLSISSNGGLHYFANLVRTIPEGAQVANKDIRLFESGDNGWQPPIRSDSAENWYIGADVDHYKNGCTTCDDEQETAAAETFRLVHKRIMGTDTMKTLLGSVYWDARKSDKMRAGLHVGTNKVFDNIFYPNTRVKYNTPDYGVLVGLKAWGSNHQNNSVWCWANPTFGNVPAEYANTAYPDNSNGYDIGGDDIGLSFYGKDNKPGIVITGFAHYGGSSGPSRVFGNRLICRLEKWKEGILNEWHKIEMSM